MGWPKWWGGQNQLVSMRSCLGFVDKNYFDHSQFWPRWPKSLLFVNFGHFVFWFWTRFDQFWPLMIKIIVHFGHPSILATEWPKLSSILFTFPEFWPLHFGHSMQHFGHSRIILATPRIFLTTILTTGPRILITRCSLSNTIIGKQLNFQKKMMEFWGQ